MASLDWMPLYVDDWLTSPDVGTLTLAQQAAYVRLLAYQWKDGRVKSDPERMARMVGVPREEFDSVAPPVLELFNLRRGYFTNKKLAVLRAKAVERMHALSKRGSKGGHAKARNIKDIYTTAVLMPEIPSNVLLSSSPGLGFTVEEKTSCPEGFPDPEVLASVEKRVPVAQAKISAGAARKVSAGGNGNGGAAWDPGAGWVQVEALCRQAPVAPAIRRPQLAVQAYISACETPDVLAAILVGIAAYKASSDVANGAVMSLENFLRDHCWEGSFARPPESETERERRRVMAL